MNKPEPTQTVIAYAASNLLGEGPVWYEERKSLLWVDIEGQVLHELKWPGKEVETWKMPQRVGMAVVENRSNVIVALQDGLARFNLETKQLTWLADIEKDIEKNRPNDGKCDAKGRLWLGTMNLECNKNAGSLYCIENDLTITKKLSDLTISNGLAWSADNKRLYFTDSSTYKIDSYLFDVESAAIEFEKTVIQVPVNMGMPDGMTIDEEGMLWVAHWDGFAVCRWNPFNGELLNKIPLPVPQVTSCTFAGENFDQLFITTAKAGLSEEQLLKYPLSGHLFSAMPGVKGRPANKFKIISQALIMLFLSLCLQVCATACFAINIDPVFADTLVRRDIKEAQQLLNNAKAGDTVFLKGGIYFLENECLQPVVSGTRDAWITIMPNPGEELVIDGTKYLDSISKTSAKGAPQKGIITLENIHFVRIKGIRVKRAHALGIIVKGKNTSNIEVVNCKSEGSYNSGIAIWYADSCKVLGCEITGANDQALRPGGYPLQGEAPHEALTLAGATHFEVANNTIHDCHKEGIDCKEVSSYGTIHHNLVYNMPRQGLYVDCWFGRLHNIEFAYNTAYNCEWGFALSAEGEGASMDSIYAHHNLLYNNRGSGVLFGVWGVDGPRSQVYIYNNTIYNNGAKAHWSGLTGGIDIMSSNISDVFIYNNISAFNYGYAIGSSVDPSNTAEFFGRENIQVTNNLEWQVKPAGHEVSKGIFKTIHPFRSTNAIISDPGFVKVEKLDFRLKKSSPALSAGWKEAPTGKTKYVGYIE